MGDRTHGDRGPRLCWAPLLSREVGFIDPTLVDVDDSRAVSEQREQRHGILLSKNENSHIVGMFGHPSHDSVAHPHVLLHDALDFPRGDFDVLFVLELVHDHLSIFNGNALFQLLVDECHDGFLGCMLLIPQSLELNILLRILLHLLHQAAN